MHDERPPSRTQHLASVEQRPHDRNVHELRLRHVHYYGKVTVRQQVQPFRNLVNVREVVLAE